MSTTNNPIELVERAKRLVIKVGTAVLTTEDHELDETRIRQLAEDVAALRKAGREVLLVTSGAIGAGVGVLGWANRPRELARSQAAASVGQGRLMQRYAAAFSRHNILVGQILLTREDLAQRRRYLNARQTMRALLREGALPVINENDSVAVEEIRFGDNDELSALVAHLMDAELLVLLSDVDGFERRLPGRKPELVPIVERIGSELERSAQGAGRSTSTGGMVSKLKAARMATTSGIAMLLANGTRPGILKSNLLEGHLAGTLFLPKGKGRMDARKRWLAYTAKPKGILSIDSGAKEALAQKGKSLLASGVQKVEGKFRKGDLVSICDGRSREFARGLINYSQKELTQIQGLRSDAIAKLLGRKAGAVVHRDSLVILQE